MKLVATHPYIQVIRKIEWNEQKYIETHHLIRLFDDRIITSNDEFLLEQVLDMSYRTNFLYLHTNRGLFSYNVKKNPNYFIRLFKNLKQ
ncbi:hypothetical protein [Fredinandcohnia quinoae]|uniref:Uncharacterized protein n=1 Tax=Fredinandcohnia quinoae TaxID=2918902 RepID=A0AAW5E1M5_9BACI|nr:hypothetical protein [Fredinandcohnia sp. SECRCQ15]MCH1626822.1 hypothetical protein [Fredinandcohnia sp. SECRCQ15]